MTLPPPRALPQPATSFYQHWRRLDDWLWRYREFWRAVPFSEPTPRWVGAFPALAHWLETLTDEQCQRYDVDPGELAAVISGWLPELEDYPLLVAMPDLSRGPASRRVTTLEEREAVDMPGRKRHQAGAFTAALLPLGLPALDWCCGKGHLARTLARQGAAPVTGYERDGSLVDDGNRLVVRYGDPVTLRRQDVMVPGLTWPDNHHGVALHACGDLHRKLVRDVIRLDQPRLSFSPCCYHLTGTEQYAPLSEQARSAGHVLALTRYDLRLAVQETVTAPAGVRRQAALVRQWRLGFDGLQRWLRGVDDYLPLPPHPKRLMAEGFEAFCRWAAAEKGLVLPETLDFHHWQAHGEARAATVRRYELLRHLFRRPLELWLVLDYALLLEESGYRVRVGTFCDRALTPRNLLVDAVRERP